MAPSLPRAARLNRHDRFDGTSKISDYTIESKLGEGTFGEVHKATSNRTGKFVALKKILMHNEKEGFPITALREIKLLKTLSHVNILTLQSMIVERADPIAKGSSRRKAIMYMVTPYMDHDLSGLLDNPEVTMSEAQIKCYMLQVLDGTRFLHNARILHRDIKAANLLINNRGILQIADFGLARYFDEKPPRPGHGCGEAGRDYTALVVTRWYRAPELLLGLRRYTCAIDMWGVGCIFGEFFKKRPILSGKTDLHQAELIFDLMGAPNETNMPGWSELPGCEGVKKFSPSEGKLAQTFTNMTPKARSLLAELLNLNWRKRINAHDAMNHEYFKSEPFPARPGDLPVYNDSHELDRKKFRDQKAAPPPAPAGGAVGMGPEDQWAQSGAGPAYRRDGWSRDGRGPPRRPDDRGPPRDGRPPPYDNRPPPYDNRRPAGPPPVDRRPGWAKAADANAPRPGAPNGRDAPGGGTQQQFRNRQGEVVDSYRPGGPPGPDAYRDRDAPPPRDYRDRDYPPRDDRYDRDRNRRGYEDRARGPPPPYDDRDRDRRRESGALACGAGADARPRQDDRRQTRSRSPDRRDRVRERDRDPYSRRG